MSAIYACDVMHCRLHPKRHQFTYQVFMLALPLHEKALWPRRILGLSHNRWNLFSINDEDHLTSGSSSNLLEKLADFFKQRGMTLPSDVHVTLLTFPRVLGYGFNPVSFFLIESADGQPIAAVAEVVNTFREMKMYVIEPWDDGYWKLRVPKNFYVSPFSDPADDFDFRIGRAGEKWRVFIDNYHAGQCVLVSSIQGTRRELTSVRMLWYGIKYPLMSLKIIAMIHWHALRLWMKKIPFFRKSERSEFQQDLLRKNAPSKE